VNRFREKGNYCTEERERAIFRKEEEEGSVIIDKNFKQKKNIRR
jgi:hypothetical protein